MGISDQNMTDKYVYVGWKCYSWQSIWKCGIGPNFM